MNAPVPEKQKIHFFGPNRTCFTFEAGHMQHIYRHSSVRNSVENPGTSSCAKKYLK